MEHQDPRSTFRDRLHEGDSTSLHTSPLIMRFAQPAAKPFGGEESRTNPSTPWQSMPSHFAYQTNESILPPEKQVSARNLSGPALQMQRRLRQVWDSRSPTSPTSNRKYEPIMGWNPATGEPNHAFRCFAKESFYQICGSKGRYINEANHGLKGLLFIRLERFEGLRDKVPYTLIWIELTDKDFLLLSGSADALNTVKACLADFCAGEIGGYVLELPRHFEAWFQSNPWFSAAAQQFINLSYREAMGQVSQLNGTLKPIKGHQKESRPLPDQEDAFKQIVRRRGKRREAAPERTDGRRGEHRGPMQQNERSSRSVSELRRPSRQDIADEMNQKLWEAEQLRKQLSKREREHSRCDRGARQPGRGYDDYVFRREDEERYAPLRDEDYDHSDRHRDHERDMDPGIEREIHAGDRYYEPDYRQGSGQRRRSRSPRRYPCRRGY